MITGLFKLALAGVILYYGFSLLSMVHPIFGICFVLLALGIM